MANPKKFEGNFRNVIKLPTPEDLKPKMQDLFKEDFVKIMEENFDKGELILENRKKNIVEDIKPMETLEDTVSQLKESGKTTARGMGFTEVYNWLTGHKRKKGTKDKDMGIKELPNKKRGCPFLLGTELDEQVKQYLNHLRIGGIVNTAITQGIVEGIVKNADRNVLAVILY